MNFAVFFLAIALVVTFFYLMVALARVREKDSTIRELSRKIFEVRTSRRLFVTNPASAENRRIQPGSGNKEWEELKKKIKIASDELEEFRKLIERFEKGLWPSQFRESTEVKDLREKLQESLLQEKSQYGASELLGRIHEICSVDKDFKCDTAVKSGTAIYNWLNQLKVRRGEKEKLLSSYTNWINKQIKPLGIYSAIVNDGETFTESVHDANGYGSRIRKVHSLVFYHQNGGVYKKARVTV